MTKKDLLKLASTLGAKDYTNKPSDEMYALTPCQEIAISYGTYGMNAGLFKKGDDYIVIKERNSNLFILA